MKPNPITSCSPVIFASETGHNEPDPEQPKTKEPTMKMKYLLLVAFLPLAGSLNAGHGANRERQKKPEPPTAVEVLEQFDTDDSGALEIGEIEVMLETVQMNREQRRKEMRERMKERREQLKEKRKDGQAKGNGKRKKSGLED